jgi:hypothetical membrane protein
MDTSAVAVPSRFERITLAAGVASPVLYFASVAAGALTYPGFSVVRQFASELGAVGAPHPLVLNVGVVLSGVATLLACAGFWIALGRVAAPVAWRRWASVATGFQGTALVVAGLFPMPDWRHIVGSSLALPALIAPALLALALGRCGRAKTLRRYLAVTNVLMILGYVAFVSARGSGVLGLLQLLYTLLAIPWVGVAAYALLRLRRPGPSDAGRVRSEFMPADPVALNPPSETAQTSSRTSWLQLGAA